MKTTSAKAKSAARLLDALADPTRLQILAMLRGRERCVCEIIKRLKLPQNLVSYHLAILKSAKLLTARKEGLKVFYRFGKAPRVKFTQAIRPFLPGR